MRTAVWMTAMICAMAAPADAQQWRGDVAPGKSIDIKGIRGTVRAVGSTDGFVHVDGQSTDPARAGIRVVEHERGITVCVYDRDRDSAMDSCESGRDNEPRPRGRTGNQARVDITVRVPDGVRLSAGTVEGDVRVEGVRGEISAATVNGSVTVQANGYRTNATTVSGDVVLELAEGQDAQLQATTVSGRIASDFPLTQNGAPFDPSRSARFPPQAVNASIGAGGTELRATTVSGDITIRRR